jgi:organic hydroperoxide reductase OsmC/OhrA
MSEHGCSVSWRRGDGDVPRLRYSRAHTWRFDGGATVPASASPHVVPPPWSDPVGVDPEEAFVAAIASCHMLSFLWLAGRRGLSVDAWDDDARGTLARDGRGRLAVTRVVLRPRIEFGPGPAPSAAETEALHHEAHGICFIAASVSTEIVVEPPRPLAEVDPRPAAR